MLGGFQRQCRPQGDRKIPATIFLIKISKAESAGKPQTTVVGTGDATGYNTPYSIHIINVIYNVYQPQGKD